VEFATLERRDARGSTGKSRTGVGGRSWEGSRRKGSGREKRKGGEIGRLGNDGESGRGRSRKVGTGAGGGKKIAAGITPKTKKREKREGRWGIFCKGRKKCKRNGRAKLNSRQIIRWKRREVEAIIR